MAVTLNSTGVTFSDATSQSTKATILSARQIGANTAATAYGNWPVSSVTNVAYWIYNMPINGASGIATDSSTTVFCGWDVYKYGTFANYSYSGDSGLDSPADSSQVYVRPVYRTIS